MKNKYFGTLFLAMVVLLSACLQDDADEVIDARNNIVNIYRVTEESEVFGVQYYDVEIMPDTEDSTQVILDNFFDRKSEVFAILEGNKLIVEPQSIDGWEVSGTGTISDNYQNIDWAYKADDGYTIEDISAYYSVKSPTVFYPGLVAEN